MAITAVSGVTQDKNRYMTTFTGKKKTQKNVNYNQQNGLNSTALKSAPIIVLLAMNPATLNSDIPNKYMPLNAQELTEVVAPIPETQTATIDLRDVQADKDVYPLGIPFFSRRKVQEIVPAIGDGVKANLVFTKLKKQGDENDVLQVYYIEHSYDDYNEQHDPPDVRGLIYHDLGEGKEFLGIKIYQPIYRDDGTKRGMMSEVKLDDVSAQYLIDLLTNDTKWNNKTGITYSETTSPKVMVPEAH